MTLRLIALTFFAALVFAAPARAQGLSADYRALLADAAVFEEGAHFESTLRMVARNAPGGAPEVIAALATAAPDRVEQARTILGVPAPVDPATTDETELAQIEAAAEAEAATEGETAGGGGILGGIVQTLFTERPESAWSGKIRAGLRWDEGNSDQQDYTFGLEAERALIGWGFNAKFEYAYSESNNAVSRDNLRAEVRGERELGERWTMFAQTDVERDRLSSYEYTAFLGAGFGYRLLEQPGILWTLRAAPGVRYQEPRVGSGETGFAGEFGSEFSWEVNHSIDFTANTNVTAAEASRAEQIFILSTRLGAGWGTEARYRYRYDFDPAPGFESSDSRLDLSLVKEF